MTNQEIVKELKERFRIPAKDLKSDFKEYELELYCEVLKINKDVLLNAVKEVRLGKVKNK